MKTKLAVLLALIAVSGFAEKHEIVWAHGKVLSQNFSSQRAGTFARVSPDGTSGMAVPMYRESNVAVIQTDRYIMRWTEPRGSVVLPVNAFIDFYQDGKWFVVVDHQGKKHKFAVIGMTVRQ